MKGNGPSYVQHGKAIYKILFKFEFLQEIAALLVLPGFSFCMKRLLTTIATTSILTMSEFSGPSKRGAFILFEGIDRCGKTTQSGLLGDYCRSIGQAESIRFPDRKSSIGQLIDSYLQSTSNLNDKAIHLLFSANRWESSTGLEAKLNAGCTLVRENRIFSDVPNLSFVDL